jgi:hypothetical protein
MENLIDIPERGASAADGCAPECVIGKTVPTS